MDHGRAPPQGACEASRVSSPDPLLLAVEATARREGFALDPVQTVVARRVGRSVTRALVGESTRGVYLYGPAGRGKSWIADAVYTAAPSDSVGRVHVHGFFDDLHRRIFAHRGEPDATTRAIDDVIDGRRVLFFDELHVHDPGDARLLTRLLERLVERGTTLVATSNYAPDELLPDPVWHHLFVPGIALLVAHLDVCPLEGPTDYRALPPRRRRGFRAGAWSTAPAPIERRPPQVLAVRDRSFPVTSADAGTLVATFAQLCDSPVTAVEYRQWASTYPRWTLTDVPPLDLVGPAAQQRFVTLIDVLADADVQVGVHSSVDLDAFLGRTRGRPDAFRMASRLRLLRRD